MRRILPSALLAVLACWTGFAASAQTESLAAIGRAGFETCMAAFPKVKSVHAAMNDGGWRFEATQGSFRIYSKNGRRVLAAATTLSYPRAGCFIAVSKMTNEQAIEMAKAIVRNVPSAQPIALKDNDALMEWSATVNGVKVRIGAMNVGDFHFMRGAGVMMISED